MFEVIIYLGAVITSISSGFTGCPLHVRKIIDKHSLQNPEVILKNCKMFDA